MNWQDERGLSLMELLVALALVAVISGALATTTNFGVQLLNRTQSIQEASPQITLRSRLRHWLVAATPPTRLAEFPTDLSGTATQVSFTTTTPSPFASAIIQMKPIQQGGKILGIIRRVYRV